MPTSKGAGAQRAAAPEQDADEVELDVDLDVRKPDRRRRRRRTTFRRSLLATTDFLQDLAAASADAFEAFADEIAGGEPDGDLVRDVASGLAEGNAVYLRRVADTPRRFVDRVFPEDRAAERVVDIDYERLAKLVADELEKRSGSVG
jgi:hypothetical protein